MISTPTHKILTLQLTTHMYVLNWLCAAASSLTLSSALTHCNRRSTTIIIIIIIIIIITIDHYDPSLIRPNASNAFNWIKGSERVDRTRATVLTIIVHHRRSTTIIIIIIIIIDQWLRSIPYSTERVQRF